MAVDYLDHSKRAGLIPALFLIMGFILTRMEVLLAQRLSQMQSKQTEQYLIEIATSTASTVNKQVSGALENISTMAALLSHHEPFKAAEGIDFLRHKHFQIRHKKLGIVTPDGEIHTTAGDFSLMEMERLPAMMSPKGLPQLYGTLTDRYDGEPITATSAPIIQGGHVIGVVFGTYSAKNFTASLEVPIFEGQGNSYLIDEGGTGVSPGLKKLIPGNNLFAALGKSVHVQGMSAVALKADIEQGHSGVVRMFVEGKEYYLAYAPVGVNNWASIIMLPYSVVNERIGNTIFWVLGTVGIWLVLFLAVIAYVMHFQRKTRREALHQAAHMAALVGNIPGGVLRRKNDADWTLIESNRGFQELAGYNEEELRTLFFSKMFLLLHPGDQQRVRKQQEEMRLISGGVTLEYRLIRKDGHAVWLVDRSHMVEEEGGNYWCSVLLDVSDRKRSQDRRRIEEERYRILFEMSDSILFEYDLRTSVLHTTRKFFEKFDYPLPHMQNTHHVLSLSIIHPEDLPQFQALHEALKNGATSAEAVLRIQKHNGSWLWCHVHQTPLLDVSNVCIKALGKITNVDTETRALHKLRDDVQRDSFTGLYNKTATTELVSKSIIHGSSDRGALCIIDVDNFKLINDVLGHCMGDTVLKDLASGLAQIFRASDIVGRIGGDEFIVFLKDIKKLRALLLKMDNVLKLFRQSFDADGKQVCISASIGIALCPKDGSNFETLYRHADKALYRSKIQKDTYNFYDADLDSL